MLELHIAKFGMKRLMTSDPICILLIGKMSAIKYTVLYEIIEMIFNFPGQQICEMIQSGMHNEHLTLGHVTLYIVDHAISGNVYNKPDYVFLFHMDAVDKKERRIIYNTFGRVCQSYHIFDTLLDEFANECIIIADMQLSNKDNQSLEAQRYNVINTTERNILMHDIEHAIYWYNSSSWDDTLDTSTETTTTDSIKQQLSEFIHL